MLLFKQEILSLKCAKAEITLLAARFHCYQGFIFEFSIQTYLWEIYEIMLTYRYLT